MVIGIFLRHYKIYKGLSFIPLSSNEPLSFTMIIGNNGVGKSSILEALDSFFNNRPFNVNIETKKQEAFVAPLFLLDKKDAENSNLNLHYCNEISQFLWEIEINQNYKNLKDFFEYRDKCLIRFRDTHYLLTFAKEFENNGNIFFTFNSAIRQRLGSLNTTKDHNYFLTGLKSVYKYVYIPVESSIEEFLKLETKGMQNLLDKKIVEEIESTLNVKRIKRHNRRLSLMDIINETLKRYIDQTERTIKKLNSGYDFKMASGQKQNLTSNDIKDQIISSYLSKRSLKKDNKPIRDLSAGERKKALIDIAYSFIIGSGNRSSNIVLAIDEPESSLHISNCYELFHRIQEISMAERCSLIHISLNSSNFPDHRRFLSKSYFEDRRNHPNDIQLKSYFDLVSSIISSIKQYDTNWLIVEGTDDYIYLSNMVNVPNLKILPVGGCGNVKVIYEFLYTPMSYKGEDGDLMGKVLCLIDTDENGPELELSSDTKNRKLRFRRLQIKHNRVEMVKNDDQSKNPISIEDCLDPKLFYNSIYEVAVDVRENSIMNIFTYEISLDNDSKTSEILGDNSMIHFNGNSHRFKEIKVIIRSFIVNHKEAIANKYVQNINDDKLYLVQKIEEFYN